MHKRLWPIFLPVFFGPLFAINFLWDVLNPKSLTVRSTFCILFLFFFFHSLQAQHQLSQSKTEILYQKGSELIAHANYGAARKVFSEFLEETTDTDPRRSEAEYYVAFSSL